ncbi:MAG: helix-turn-helix domain-containing protein [Candidatus Scatomorpha sp.]|jgi:transcriptional regulator with XRE-family HTH domain
MNMADRIQYLRKTKGISQEALADKVGVSRQAVSKWESEQSIPDLEKIIIMSDLFGVTTDYILKGIEPAADKEQKGRELASKALYVASTAFVFIGLFAAFGSWHEEQTMEAVWGSMIIQAVGVAAFFIGKFLTAESAPFYVDWLNILGVAFMPISMISGYLSMLIFKQGWIAPYPADTFHILIFSTMLLVVGAVSFIFLKERKSVK